MYLPAIVEYVPPEMVKALSAFMDFCYLVRRTDFDEDTLTDVSDALARFHEHRTAFRCVRDTFSLPRQHSLSHYPHNIREFGAPGGLCSSITESRHITAVKKPWRRSNRYNALSQMLLTNERIDKLVGLRSHFVERGMLPPEHGPPPNPLDEENMEEGAVDDQLLAEVKLARYRGKSENYSCN